MKKKIAVINQRYGLEVNGGSEYYARKLAENLNQYYDIEVLTTTALDYDTWKPYYKTGTEVINGVIVKRFAVKRERNQRRFKAINDIMVRLSERGRKIWGKIWLDEQGPNCPELIRYIKKNEAGYDAFIFVTYLYYTTARGILQHPEKSILVPTAHDEYCIYFPMYRNVFKLPRGIAYLTEEEEKFTEQLFNISKIPHVLAGSGIEVPSVTNAERALKKYNITNPYLIYVGRVDIGKSCDEMFEYFQEYKKENPGELKLVVIGKLMIAPPDCQDIKCLGFISDEEKYDLMSGAEALILPSKHESLSLSVLESMALGKPVIVNGQCQVLKAHCDRSGAGYSYLDYGGFKRVVNVLLEDENKKNLMGEKGKIYVKENYSWEAAIGEYRKLLEDIL